MRAQPVAGDAYYQEFYATAAEDMVQIVATGVTVQLPGGTTYSGCVRRLDWDPLDPDGLEYKYYAPGIGLVLEESLDDGEELELTGTSR